ncbi:L-threonylcarbamoyladenylate synthase [Jiulongibacter sediminis]|uniref:Threonylcarbamoyl-AMP synthase n=1 Tax=Jiulongibacter sediminis TaxID=1605367 RepID=A0A0P7C5E8_9BACT|nr:L-threonylcarbamoyladenylate synthase [Jiulongibacter sediminis]KPM49547.1 translation factor (SUA5) [Jiulongibacter sediminis]TBX26588.1 translation factor (SUA5) [Jiulongibacter sediminis]
MAEIGKDIIRAKDLLEAGEVIGLPTETVYGLAANALNPVAVAKIFEVKNRPTFDPLIIHTDSIEKVKDWVESIPLDLELMFRKFSPGPLTLLLPRKPIIPDLVTSGLPRVAVRIPSHPIALDLLSQLDFPLAAPSANPFGYISPTSALHVNQQLGDQISYILDGGSCEVGLESTIVGFEDNQLTVYRKGGLAIEKIEEYFGPVEVKEHSSSNPSAPGMLKSHYAPNKEVKFLDDLGNKLRKKIGLLRFSEVNIELSEENQFILSNTKNLNEAAQRLFEGLRYLDGLDIETIYLELVPDIGIGRAINDRLRRAAAQG